MLTLLQALEKTTEFFSRKGIERPRLDAELLLAHALGLKRLDLYLQFDRPLSDTEQEAIREPARRRGSREPLQYIIGEVDFFGLNLKVDRRALIPRPETEHLVELMTERIQTPPTRVLDLGTGSGAIALALASHWKNTEVMAIDASNEALELARENAERTGLSDRVTFTRSDWFEAVEGTFELIVSNPPYLSQSEWRNAAPDIRQWEPVSALTAPDNGLDCIKSILRSAPRHLNPQGCLALEIAPERAGGIQDLDTLAFHSTEFLPDLTDRTRYWLGSMPEA